MSDNVRIPLAEAIGTAVLVIGGAGTAILATGGFEDGLSVGILGVSLAFGLSLLTMAYLIGRISGCHINPAVTIGRTMSDTFAGIAPASAPAFVVAQLIAGSLAVAVAKLIYPGKSGT